MITYANHAAKNSRPYHPANFKLQPYPAWKVKVLAWVAKAMSIQFHIHGIPFGGRHHV